MVKLKPAGYPLKDFSRSFPVNIASEKLFGIYSREQWMGATVEKGDYIFDQRLIPDFAFLVSGVLPRGRVMITESTRILLESGASRGNSYGVKLGDVVGHRLVKEKLKVIMHYLGWPEKFGEWAPRNLLFYGPPGTGKTMSAKALASETSSRLFMVRATELIGEYVGDGSKKIHELYSSAVDSAPAIIFIDELDAIGLSRVYQGVRGDVGEIVNALLSELDGLKVNTGVVTIASTNNAAMLDQALSSRFEEFMEFNLPTRKERLKILKLYSSRMPMRVKANLKSYASRSRGFSGRDLKERLLKVALHRAILEQSSEVREEHLECALKQLRKESGESERLYS